jgi:hypothetical protein
MPLPLISMIQRGEEAGALAEEMSSEEAKKAISRPRTITTSLPCHQSICAPHGRDKEELNGASPIIAV